MTTESASTAAPVEPGAVADGAPDQDLAARVTALEAAQPAQTTNARPWNRQASVLLAVLALAFSMMATWFGEQRAGERDESAARVELSQIIQRLVSLPKENAELQKLYAGDPAMLNALSAMVATENDVLTRQASDVIKRIPDRVSGSEYFAVGQALVLTGNYGRAETLLDAGLSRDNDASSRAALWRVKGALYFATGELALARAAMSSALEAYAAEQPSAAAAAAVYTEWAWAVHEKTNGDCEEAKAHLDRAQGHLETLPMTPYKVEMMQLLSAASTNPTEACPSP